MVYVPQLDAFLVRANAAGPKVYKVDAETFAVSILVTAGGANVPQGQVLSYEENVYNKWLYAPTLLGVVYFPKTQDNAWFLRLV